MDGPALPDGDQLTFGLLKRPLDYNKSIASAIARRKRMKICRFRFISSADCLEAPAVAASSPPYGGDELNLDIRFVKAEEDVACADSASSEPKVLTEESCTGSSVEDESFGDSHLPSIKESDDLNLDRQFANSCGGYPGEAASEGCLSAAAPSCNTEDSDRTKECTATAGASPSSTGNLQPFFAVSSDRIAAEASSSSLVCTPETRQCGCLSASLTNPSHSFISICGRRRDMEDSVTILPSFLQIPCFLAGSCSQNDSQDPHALSDLHFYGVYDGHGGNQAANYCKDHLHQALAEEIRTVAHPHCHSNAWDSHWKRALEASFLRIDQEISSSSDPIAPETVGSTAVVAVVGPCQIIVANCGDSRAVLSRKGRAIPLSVDHKPDREDEMARVEAAGGRVIYWNGHRVLGVLAMSRALGDRYLKPYVIANPEVTYTQRSEDDECLILASDGLWDVLSNDIVCEVARKCLSSNWSRRGASSRNDETAYTLPAAIAAAMLTKLALSKGSSDNISVIVVDLMSRLR